MDEWQFFKLVVTFIDLLLFMAILYDLWSK